MDLRLFHPTGDPTRYKKMDRVNSRTGKLACHTYEWIGWYNMSIPKRLLEHYRLFQLYKARRPYLESGMTPTRGYILQCRSTNGLKDFLNRCFTFLNAVVSRGNSDRTTEVHGINRILLFQRTEEDPFTSNRFGSSMPDSTSTAATPSTAEPLDNLKISIKAPSPTKPMASDGRKFLTTTI